MYHPVILQQVKMQCLDLKGVNKISQKYKDIVNGFIKKVQSSLPSDNTYFNVVDAIKHLILLYYFSLFESDILFGQEQDKFLSLLQENNKIIAKHPWKLLYQSNKDGEINKGKFVKIVHGKMNILSLIRLNEDCIIGGYTKVGWATTTPSLVCGYNYYSDGDAFLFYFKSNNNDHQPFISNITDSRKKYALSDHPTDPQDLYGAFGQGYLLYFQDTELGLQGQDGTYRSIGFFEDEIRLDGKRGYSMCTKFELEIFQVDEDEISVH